MLTPDERMLDASSFVGEVRDKLEAWAETERRSQRNARTAADEEMYGNRARNYEHQAQRLTLALERMEMER